MNKGVVGAGQPQLFQPLFVHLGIGQIELDHLLALQTALHATQHLQQLVDIRAMADVQPGIDIHRPFQHQRGF